MPDQEWTINDQTPDNPYGKSEDYEAFLTYLGALNRSLTPAIAANPLRINVSELRDHPDFLDAAVGALRMWAAVTPLRFEMVTDTPYNAATDWMRVISPELGETNEGTAFSSNRNVSIGQRFHDTEPDRTAFGGYVFDSFIHEFGHEFGLNHPGLYNYSGPGGVQINSLNNATWIYDRQQYSVMSYFDGIDVGEETRWSATTPLIADIEAVIRRFFSTVDANGVRTYQQIQLNTGNDTYGFGSTKFGFGLTSSGMTHDIGFVIHDTGGNDTINFSGSTAGTTLDLRAGHFSSVNGHLNNVSIFDGHNADQTGYYIERGIGSAYDDVILGNDGNNVLIGGGGDDKMAGFGGNDVYYVDSEDDLVAEDADGGTDTVILLNRSLRGLTFANVENVIVAPGSTTPAPVVDNGLPDSSPSDAPIYGDIDDNELDGGSGGDFIYGRGGNDTIVGGQDTKDSRDINNTLPHPTGPETDDGDDWLYGNGGDDDILGGAGNDRLYGGIGNDRMSGQAGEDVFYGGAGIDTVDYSRESPFQLLVNLALNIASGGTGSGDRFFGIENLIGSDDRIDRFIGTNAANHFWGLGGGDYLSGGGGNDTLDSGRDGDILHGDAGDDTLIGGAGQDALHGDGGVDTAIYADSDGGVFIDLSTGRGRGGDAEGPVQVVGQGTSIQGEYLFSIENVTGSRFTDRFTGSSAANVFNGGAGSDWIDLYNETSRVTVDLQTGRFRNDTWISIENIAGSAQNDSITGDDGANSLVGQGGNDIVNGGDGNDRVFGDFAPLPTAGVEVGTNGYAVLDGTATNNSFATAFDMTDNFSLTADTDISNSTTAPHSTVTATGNGQAAYYKVTLNEGTILRLDIDRTSSADLDSYLKFYDADGNEIAENDDGGGDPGSTRATDSSMAFVIKETGTYYIAVGSYDNDGGTGYIPVIPVGVSYELSISAGDPTPTPAPGTAGNDILNGGAGNDLLAGGAGNDNLTGGSGLDLFLFDTAPGTGNVDTITDFNVAQDNIYLDDAVMAALGATGPLAAAAFRASASGAAGDADDRILYDTNGGQLYYDADGNGAGARVLFARMSTNLALTAADFVVV